MELAGKDKDKDINKICSDLYDAFLNLHWDFREPKMWRALPYAPSVIQAKRDYEGRYSVAVEKVARIDRFMTLFARLKKWTDGPDSLAAQAEEDPSVRDLCSDLFMAAFNASLYFSNSQKRIILMVDNDQILAWREYNERYSEIVSNYHHFIFSLPEGHVTPSPYVARKRWEIKEHNWDYADNSGEIAQESLDRTINSLKEIGQLLINNEESFFCDEKDLFEIFKSIRPSYSHDNLSNIIENTYGESEQNFEEIEKLYNNIGDKKSLKLISDQIELFVKNDLIYKEATLTGVSIRSIYKFLEDSVEYWEDLKKECHLDVRGAVRRHELIPVVLVPRPVSSARNGVDYRREVLENLRQAQEAFKFGAPRAALALLRSIVEAVLRDHYRAEGTHLEERIRNARRLPDGANKVRLGDLRTQANAILHINKGVTEVEEKNEKQFEMRMVEFFGTVRALIEGVK